MSWTGAFGRGCRVLLTAIVRRMAIARVSPNVLTFLGLVINLIAACFFGYASGPNQRAMFFYAGLVVFAAGFMDLVDGRVARASNRVTRFGGFFDSVVDRYSDVAIFFGLLVYYARANRFFYVVLVAIVMTGSVMVSYTRARAESLIGSCRVGFLERPERLVLVIIGAVFNHMAPVLWVLAVFSNITVIHRIYYTWQKTKPGESAENISAA
jgi:CDP-diacylglycerol--glycerol-3-phosphate 3-phosphatidyltransferase